MTSKGNTKCIPQSSGRHKQEQFYGREMKMISKINKLQDQDMEEEIKTNDWDWQQYIYSNKR
jgi:hypothetical protein